MNQEEAEYRHLRVQSLIDLRWQRDVNQRWAQTSQIPADSKLQLEEMLVQVDAELSWLQLAHAADQDATTKATAHKSLITTTDMDGRSMARKPGERPPD
jgi:hypothetical protein